MLGKLPPPFIGPAVATEIILNSSLVEHYELIHFDTSLNRKVSGFGKKSPKKVVHVWRQQKLLKKLLKQEDPDLIIIPISQTTPGFYKDSMFVKIASHFRAKCLVQLRGSNFKNWYDQSSKRVKGLVNETLGDTNGVIVLGDNLKYLFEEHYADDKIHVVPNGCDIESRTSTAKSEPIQLLYLSNFVRGKGFLQLLQGLTLVKDLNWTLNAYGAWHQKEYEEECLKFLSGSGLQDKVKIHPPISGEEKWLAFSGAHCFLFTPIDPEGHPWVTVEASAMGLPIIATDRGAMRNCVHHEKNGFVLADPSPERIAEAVDKMISDPSMREQMAKESRTIYEQGYTAQQMVEALREAIDKTLKE